MSFPSDIFATARKWDRELAVCVVDVQYAKEFFASSVQMKKKLLSLICFIAVNEIQQWTRSCPAIHMFSKLDFRPLSKHKCEKSHLLCP